MTVSGVRASPFCVVQTGNAYQMPANRPFVRPTTSLSAGRIAVPMAAGVAFSALPKRKRTLGQCAIVIVALSRHLGTNPRRQFDGMVLVGKLDFRNDQAVVVAGKNVDFPGEHSARHDMANFFDDDALPE